MKRETPMEVDERNHWPLERPDLAREFNDLTEALGLGRRLRETEGTDQ